MIRKRGHKWCVLSPDNPDWSGGCYRTKKEAEKRLRQVERAKHARGMGQGRICWEVEDTGLSWNQAKKIKDTIDEPFRLTYDDRTQDWTLELRRPCQPHPMERFMYRGMGRRRRRRRR